MFFRSILKKKTFILLIFIAVFLADFLIGRVEVGLYIVNTLARFSEGDLHKNIIYNEKNEQRLDIYTPVSIDESTSSSLTTVVFFYGGCWGACSNLVKEDYRFVAQALTANELIAVIVNVRKYPSVLFPEIMEDAVRSFEWVSQNIEAYGGDKKNIFLMGHSSGAHIASMLAFNENYLSEIVYRDIKGFIGLAGPYDFLPFTEAYQPALFAPPENYALSQTINYVTGNESPTLLLYGNDDTRVERRNIDSLSHIIQQKRGRVETRLYENVDHISIVSALAIPFQTSMPVLKDIISFVTRSD